MDFGCGVGDLFDDGAGERREDQQRQRVAERGRGDEHAEPQRRVPAETALEQRDADEEEAPEDRRDRGRDEADAAHAGAPLLPVKAREQEVARDAGEDQRRCELPLLVAAQHGEQQREPGEHDRQRAEREPPAAAHRQHRAEQYGREQEHARDRVVGRVEVVGERVVAVVRERLGQALRVVGLGARRERVVEAGDVVLERLGGGHAGVERHELMQDEQHHARHRADAERGRQVLAQRRRGPAALPGSRGGDRGEERAGDEQALMRRAVHRVDLVLEAVRAVPHEIGRPGDRRQWERDEGEPVAQGHRDQSRSSTPFW